MKTLISRDSYAEIEERFWARARRLMGILFGIVMFLTSVIQQSSVLGFGLSVSVGLVIGVVTGTMFGWLWAWIMRRSARKFFERVYHGEPSVIGEPPQDWHFTYRIPCSLFVTNNVAIGGILYLGQPGVQFVPHKRHRGERRLEFEREGLVVWAKDWKPNWWGRTFVLSGPRILEICSGDKRFAFAFPDVDVVVPRIREALGQ